MFLVHLRVLIEEITKLKQQVDEADVELVRFRDFIKSI